jgi:hypothetical protein
MNRFAHHRRAFLLLLAVAVFAMPRVSYAQFGGLANMAKGKAVEVLAVYVFGAEDPALNKALTTRLITALGGSGYYRVTDNYKEFFERAVAEAGTTSLSAEQFKSLGQQFGVKYVCVVEIAPVFGENQASAHILDVETGKVKATGAADVPLKTLADLSAASEQIVKAMFKNAPPVASAQTTAPAPVYVPPVASAQTTAPAPVYSPPPPTVYAPPPAPVYAPPPPQPLYAQPQPQYTDQDPRRALAPADTNAVYNFSGGERFGTFAINWLIPGLGSAAVMQDWSGAGIQVLLYGLGVGLLSASITTSMKASATNSHDGSFPLVIGTVVAFGANFTYNIARSATYKKPGSVDRPNARPIRRVHRDEDE